MALSDKDACFVHIVQPYVKWVQYELFNACEI